MDLPGHLKNIEHLIKNNFTLKGNEIDDVLKYKNIIKIITYQCKIVFNQMFNVLQMTR